MTRHCVNTLTLLTLVASVALTGCGQTGVTGPVQSSGTVSKSVGGIQNVDPIGPQGIGQQLQLSAEQLELLNMLQEIRRARIEAVMSLPVGPDGFSEADIRQQLEAIEMAYQSNLVAILTLEQESIYKGS